MNMAMEEIWWLVFFDEVVESPESPVAEVFFVIDMAWWSVGEYQVRPPASPEGKSHPGDETTHFFFRILVDSTVIPPASRKPDNLFVFKGDYLPINVAAADRRGRFVAKVMVTEYVKQRHVISEQ